MQSTHFSVDAFVGFQMFQSLTVLSGEGIQRCAYFSGMGLPFSKLPFGQWEFQDPKMEVLYHIRPYVLGSFPFSICRYLQFRSLKWLFPQTVPGYRLAGGPQPFFLHSWDVLGNHM